MSKLIAKNKKTGVEFVIDESQKNNPMLKKRFTFRVATPTPPEAKAKTKERNN